jgi:hypothetical protein
MRNGRESKVKVSKLAGLVVAAASLAAASPAAAQFGGGTCTREELQDMADKYIKAQTEGLPLYMPMGNWVTYHENGKLSTMSQGTLSIPLEVSWHRALLDVPQCKVFLELTSHEGDKPYVIAVQFSARGGNASGFQVVSSTTGD